MINVKVNSCLVRRCDAMQSKQSKHFFLWAYENIVKHEFTRRMEIRKMKIRKQWTSFQGAPQSMFAFLLRHQEESSKAWNQTTWTRKQKANTATSSLFPTWDDHRPGSSGGGGGLGPVPPPPSQPASNNFQPLVFLFSSFTFLSFPVSRAPKLRSHA